MGISGKSFVYYSFVVDRSSQVATNLLPKFLENHVPPKKSMLSTPPPTGMEAPASEETSNADIVHRAGGIVCASVHCVLKPLPVLPANVDSCLAIEGTRPAFQSVFNLYSLLSQTNSNRSASNSNAPACYGEQDV